MEKTPENHSQVCLSQTEINAQFRQEGMLAHFQNTCNPRTVKAPEVGGSSKNTKQGKKSSWEFIEFLGKSDNVKQCKLRMRPTIFEEEEEYEVLWYRCKDGKIYVLDNLDPALLGL
jgi:hypothetical protein